MLLDHRGRRGGSVAGSVGAEDGPREVELDAKNIPILGSPTDGKKKQLDGWIDLDRLPRDP